MKSIETTHGRIEPSELDDNFFRTIGDEWMLITAGNPEEFNTMTASWGGIGILWNKPVAICFIRPTRHTYSFSEREDYFTLTFFTDEYKKTLQYCGTKSGKDVNKIEVTGLIPLLTENQSVGFEQSRLCLECKKIYFDDLKPEQFLLPGADKTFYPKKDYHRMYIAEILNVYKK